ncbi:MAG: right-handed parallel beta-helix repeat-containing protein [Candidatus Krumholzibacteriia bacterium]
MNAAHRLALVAIICVVYAALAGAQPYTTPGTGVDWTMDDLAAAAGFTVQGAGGAYAIHDLVTIAVNDRLTIAPGTTLTFAAGAAVGLDVNGALEARGTAAQPIVFQGADPTPGSWRGLDHGDTGPGSAFVLEHCEVAHAVDAVDAFGADIELRNCDLHDTLGKVIDISAADGLVSGCHLHDNRQRTITLTLTSSPTIEDCVFERNNLDNSSPYPYINIGLQGTNSPTIRGNEIHGDGNFMSGGIALWNLSNALIEDNLIEGCGYGILCYQTGANPVILGNEIRDNTIHPDTLNWGFGVACNGNNSPILMGNRISGHWYGVAAINGGRPNLGDLVNDFPGDDGGNAIEQNGLGGQVYGFYNNTPLAQIAQGNWWGTDNPEDAIYHQVDDPSLGLVDYDFFVTAVDAPAPSASLLGGLSAYPNPFNPRVEIAFDLARGSLASLIVLDVRGRLVRELLAADLAPGHHVIAWDGADRQGRPVPSGTYFARIVAGHEATTGRLTLVR